jgi:hypothetical protein
MKPNRHITVIGTHQCANARHCGNGYFLDTTYVRTSHWLKDQIKTFQIEMI